MACLSCWMVRVTRGCIAVVFDMTDSCFVYGINEVNISSYILVVFVK